jgi:glycosyltransferase involved in cell wall biosynthesis
MMGSFDGCVCGESVYNHYLRVYLRKNPNANVSYICTDITGEGQQLSGGFKVGKVVRMVTVYVAFLKRIFDVDVIYITPGLTTFGVARFLPVYLLSMLLGVKIVSHYHGARLVNTLGRGIVGRLFLKIIKKIDANVFLSDSLMCDFEHVFGGLRNSYVIPNGIPDDYYQKDNHSVCGLSLKVLYLGNLIESKGVYDAVNSAIKLNKMGVEINLDIVGRGVGGILDDVKNYALKYDFISYLGPLYGEDKLLVLKKSDILLFPSTYDQEAFPLVVLEAMASSCLVISYDVGAVKEMVSDSGEICESNVESIVEYLLKYSNNKEKLLVMKDKAYSRAMNFKISYVLAQLESVICAKNQAR